VCVSCKVPCQGRLHCLGLYGGFCGDFESMMVDHESKLTPQLLTCRASLAHSGSMQGHS
jgi:hypothetical protein